MFSFSAAHSTMKRKTLQLSAIFFYLIAFVNAWRPCSELSAALRIPCKCQLEPFGVNGQVNSVGMDCDRVIFTSETPQIPTGAPITTYSQRHSGQQSLPAQVNINKHVKFRFLLCGMELDWILRYAKHIDDLLTDILA